MREKLSFSVPEITPKPERVSGKAESRVKAIQDQAFTLFSELARPVGILSEVSIPEFGEIFRGEGKNEVPVPLEDIFPRAERLALYALTLGEAVSSKISGLFESGDFTLGYLLDSVASQGAELASEKLAQHWEGSLSRPGMVLGYSPGYCGWHMSGQKAIFAALHPGEVGISLGESFLMQPIKSMSGVLVVGQRKIHQFENNFPFCVDCRDWSCRVRIQELQGRGRS